MTRHDKDNNYRSKLIRRKIDKIKGTDDNNCICFNTFSAIIRFDKSHRKSMEIILFCRFSSEASFRTCMLMSDSKSENVVPNNSVTEVRYG